jgi:hypothetical protein
MASELPGLRARPLWKNQADIDERADSRTWRFAAESARFGYGIKVGHHQRIVVVVPQNVK